MEKGATIFLTSKSVESNQLYTTLIGGVAIEYFITRH